MRLRRGFEGWWIALLAALADRLTKRLAAGLSSGGPLIEGLINLRPVRNTGMAFSMLSGRTAALTGLTALLVLGILGWLVARHDAPRLMRAGLWLIVGGGLGNLYDRLTVGSVLDFIELSAVRFAVFNVADVCICLGAALTVIGSAGVRNEE